VPGGTLATDSPIIASIVVPCHNAAAFLPATLASILSQSVESLEVLVVDDGSTDGSAAVVTGIGDDRVRLWRQSPSGGPSGPRNRAIAEARGRYVFFCDADDVMYPGKVARQVAILEENPGVALVFTDFAVIDGDGRVLEPSFLGGYQTLRDVVAAGAGPGGALRRDLVVSGLLKANFIGTSSVAVRRSVLEQVGPFDETLASSEDLELWLRIARGHTCAFLDMVGHGYRRHPASLMQEGTDRHPLARIEVLRRQLAAGITAADRRVIRGWLASNYCSLGYLEERRGHFDPARQYYLESVRARPNQQAAWGLAKSAMTGGWRLARSRQFLTYMGVGAVGTGVHYLTLFALVRWGRLDPVLAATCGYVVGAVVNYVANYHLTFRSSHGHARTMSRFFLIAGAGMGINAAIVALGHRGWHLHYMVSQVAATGVVVVLTYLANRAWTFREVSDERPR
jgi:glycosyltransferase involved in cell wall biosynthesis/putative flippase GtrA